MSMSGIPRWVILLLGAGLILFGFAASQGWIRDPSLAKTDYTGTIDVSPAIAPHGLKVVEMAPGVSREELQAKTGAPLH